MKVYLASAYARKEEMRKYAQELRDLGIEVTSRWLEEPHSPTSTLADVTEAFKIEVAEQDLEDIEAADCLVFFSEPQDQQPPRGGRHVEFGFALGNPNIDVIVVGNEENIFHYLDEVTICDTWDIAVVVLDALKEELEK